MTIENIETIAILVQIDGNCHQVLTTKKNKEAMLLMLAGLDGGLTLDQQIEPLTFEYKKNGKPKNTLAS